MQSPPMKSSPKKYASSMGQVLPGLWVGNIMSIAHVVDIAIDPFEDPSSQSPSSALAEAKRHSFGRHHSGPASSSRLDSPKESSTPSTDDTNAIVAPEFTQQGPGHNITASKNREVIVTVISVLSNPNMIRMAKDLVEKQRLRLQELQRAQHKECHNKNNKRGVSRGSEGEKQIQREDRCKTDECTQDQKSNAANNDFPTVRIGHRLILLKDSIESDLMAVIPQAIRQMDEALGYVHDNIDDSASINHYDENNNNTHSNTPKTTKNDNNYDTVLNNLRTNKNTESIQQQHQKDAITTTNPAIKRICLVHCAKGQSRSVSLIIAYLLTRFPETFKTFTGTLAHIKSVRPGAMPNVGFALALRILEKDKIVSPKQIISDDK